MYVTKLRTTNIRLLADQEISFTGAEGKPRLWTVLLGDNGCCKTTILQVIALCELGEAIAQASEFDPRWLVRHGSEAGLATLHAYAAGFPYRPFDLAAQKYDTQIAGPGKMLSGHLGPARTLRSVNADVPGLGFLVGFGAQRTMPQPGDFIAAPAYAQLDRAKPLFAKRHKLLATEFYKLLGTKSPTAPASFTEALNGALTATLGDEELFPRLLGIERNGNGGQALDPNLYTSRFRFRGPDGEVKLESYNLSDGYQSMIAWIADLIGHYALDAGKVVPPAEMQGVVLLDEIDLHLHPTWQRRIVPILKCVFPKLQFIVTTHSPLVLTGFEADEIVRLEFGDDGLVHARQGGLETGLMDATETLDEYFGVYDQGNAAVLALRDEWAALTAHTRRSPKQTLRLEALEAELARYYRGRGMRK